MLKLKKQTRVLFKSLMMIVIMCLISNSLYADTNKDFKVVTKDDYKIQTRITAFNLTDYVFVNIIPEDKTKKYIFLGRFSRNPDEVSIIKDHFNIKSNGYNGEGHWNNAIFIENYDPENKLCVLSSRFNKIHLQNYKLYLDYLLFEVNSQEDIDIQLENITSQDFFKGITPSRLEIDLGNPDEVKKKCVNSKLSNKQLTKYINNGFQLNANFEDMEYTGYISEQIFLERPVNFKIPLKEEMEKVLGYKIETVHIDAAEYMRKHPLKTETKKEEKVETVNSEKEKTTDITEETKELPKESQEREYDDIIIMIVGIICILVILFFSFKKITDK